MTKNIFPKGFFFGAATSSHQVEGGCFNDWSEWEKKNAYRLSHIANRYYNTNNYISGRACDHYHKFKEDFKLAKKLGANAHRFSIEWSRIEPKEGEFNYNEIKHYQEVIDELRKLKIEPFITLWHFTLPVWLADKKGWENKKAGEYFLRYVKKIVSELKNVRFFITLNEPEVYASQSYFYSSWPPQKKSFFSYLKVLNNLIKAHKLAYQVIKNINPKLQVGLVTNNTYFEVAGINPFHYLLKKAADWWNNEYFLNKTAKNLDFIGLNYYFHNRIDWRFNNNSSDKRYATSDMRFSDMGWELYPEGIYRVLCDLKKYQKPIIITENGLADKNDQYRAWFIGETLKNIQQAISEGVDVRGYLHWSLLDNFEWDKGFWPRFGLIEIDYKTLKRTPRQSAYFFRDMIN